MIYIFETEISNLKPVANSPFKKIEGTSRIEPIALVNSLKEKIPKLASSINHFVIKVIFFAIGSLKLLGNSIK